MKNNLNSQSLYPKVDHGRLSKPLIPLGLAGRSMASKEALNPLLLKDSSE